MHFRWLPFLTLAALGFAPFASAQDAPAPDKTRIQVSFERDLPIQDLIERAGRDLGRPVFYDPNGQRIRGQKVSTAFSATVDGEELLSVYRSILSFYELTLVAVGPADHEIYLVVDSRSTNNYVKNRAEYVPYEKLDAYADRDGLYVSCAVPIRHIDNLTTLRTALSTMVSPAGIGRVHEVPGADTIIIMDFAPVVASMARLIRQMDVLDENNAEVLESIELQHAPATVLAGALRAALAKPAPAPAQARRGGAVSREPPARIVPYEPRNALIVAGTGAQLKTIRALVATLDVPAATR